jgi:hypothetical protein
MAAMSIRPQLIVIPGGRLDAAERRQLFERAHPEVTFVEPIRSWDRWRAVVPAGSVPGEPDAAIIGDLGLSGLMDKLELIWPPQPPARM